jgi:hypothetical protein
MKRTHWLRALLFSVLALLLPTAPAQTNDPGSSAPSSSGPVVTPPTGKGPPVPQTSPDSTPTASPAVASPAQPGDEDIYDIRPPLFFLRSWLWLWLVLAALALAGLIVLLVLWLRRRFAATEKTAYELTLERLEQARALMNENDPRPYGNAVSEVIRTYLGQRFQARSTRRTTEEFLRDMETNPAGPLAQHRELLRDFLQACDLLKFARYQPGPAELEQVHRSAMTFVTATKPAPITAESRAAAAQLVPRTT